MAVFTRRRIAHMLAELSPLLTGSKRRDLIIRVEHVRTDQAMAAEAELGLLWALAQITDIELEPLLDGCKGRPDALAPTLVPGRRTAVEITAVSDDAMSGEDVMRRAASILSREANRIKAKSGSKMYFTFHEVMGYRESAFFRRRRVAGAFQVDEALRAKLGGWLNAWPDTRSSPLRLTNPEIDVTIEYDEHVHPLFNFFCSMPAVTYSLSDNTLYKALEIKERQLRGATEDLLRFIFVADAGCYLLRHFRSVPRVSSEVSGQEIIQHFMVRRPTVDVVCVFCPVRAGEAHQLQWRCDIIHRDGKLKREDLEQLKKVASSLPRPRFEAYKARALHRQGAFAPQARGWWLPMSETTTKADGMIIRLSSRALQEILAGRVPLKAVLGEPNPFEFELMNGNLIKAVRLEEGGIDEDDDYIVLELGPDVAAKKMPGGKR